MTATSARVPARPAMRVREFTDLADEVAAACVRRGVPVWSEDDQDRLEAALWQFIHPDLAGTPADPYQPEDWAWHA